MRGRASSPAVPEQPILFFKHPNTVVGPFDAIERPTGAETLDREAELALVIGTAAWQVPEADALADGDVVEIGVDGLGTQRSVIVG